jgi:deazaflavin-dependent oxidoreductase (nitroreductase family)
MAAAKRGPVVDLFWKLHPWIYRISGGRLLGRLVGMKVLLLTTTGARSGVSRTTALTYFEPPGQDAYVVIGSFLGEPRDPGWVHNLRAHPDALIQVGSRAIRVRAREGRGEERAQLWKQLISINGEYAQYEGRTDRVIPVVVLSPLDGSSPNQASPEA